MVWDDRPPTFLHHLLADRMHLQFEATFGLLALIHPPEDIRPAQHGLLGEDPARRSHALEYLDNTLSGEVRSTVLAAIGDEGHARRFARARQLFGHLAAGHLEAVLRLVGKPVATPASSRRSAVGTVL